VLGEDATEPGLLPSWAARGGEEMTRMVMSGAFVSRPLVVWSIHRESCDPAGLFDFDRESKSMFPSVVGPPNVVHWLLPPEVRTDPPTNLGQPSQIQPINHFGHGVM
jgi:hypothetical protein